MASLVAALDKITNLRKGENGHTEYQWSEPRPDPLRTASPTEGGSRLQASLADPKGGLDGSTTNSEGFAEPQAAQNLDSLSRIPVGNPTTNEGRVAPGRVWTGITDIQEKIVQLHFQLVRTDKFHMDELAKKFHELIRELGFIRETVPENDRIDMICSLYCMLGQTRDIVAGKGEYALSYMMLYELSIYYPEMANYALEQFVLYDMNDTNDDSENNVDAHPYGSWKDLKYLAAYCKQKSHRCDHGLIKKCIELTNQQLRKDMMCTDDTKLSLCAKWVPREGSQFGWLFQLLAKDFYKGVGYLDTAQDSVALRKAEKKCYMEYRRVISGLNKRIDTVQIKQCGRTWADIDHNKTTSITVSRNKKAFLNLNKKGEQRSELTDRVDCADNFKKYLADLKTKGKEVKGKRVGMEEFTRRAIELIRSGLSTSQDECDILNSQWRDNSKQTGALHKMIAMVDTSGSMYGDPLHAAISLGIRVAEKSVLGKRILTFSAVPTWHDLEGLDTFIDMVRETMKASWQMNTNFYAALELILDTMISNEVQPEDVDGLVLAVFSDMQIDQADSTYIESNNNNTMMQEIERKYLEAGYKCPHILFWNLRSTDGFPSLSTVKGASMLSGFSPALLNLFCEKGVEALESLTPRSMMMESLAHPRYARLNQFARKFLSYCNTGFA